MNERTIEHRLAWLAGIIDGEGWIGLKTEVLKGCARRGKNYVGATWYVGICNTDEAMLVEIMEILSLISVKHMYTPFAAQKRPNRKPQGRVTVHQKDSCKVLLEAVYPYLITKKSRAALLLRSIAHRALKGHHWRHPEYIRIPDDSVFLAMVDQMKDMNRKGTSPVGGDKCQA